MNDVINVLDKHKLKILLSVLAVMVMHYLIHIFDSGEVGIKISLFISNFLFIGFGWTMPVLVLGFQGINPFCPKPLLKGMCFLFMLIFLVGLFIGLASDLVLVFMDEHKKSMPGALTPAVVAMIYGVKFIYKKHFMTEMSS